MHQSHLRGLLTQGEATCLLQQALAVVILRRHGNKVYFNHCAIHLPAWTCQPTVSVSTP
jgi:hypothetical protein